MNRFLQNFLREAPGKLSQVRRELQNLREQYPLGKTQTRQSLRQVFQQVHTLKGSAAAFGMENVRGLAHELENLLDRLCFGETVCDNAALDALEAGIDEIEIAFAASNEYEAAVKLQESQKLIHALTVDERPANTELDEIHLPAEFFEKLNKQEKRHLQQIAADDATVSVFAVKFLINEFQEKLQSLRFDLEREGEIVALLPGAFTTPGEIALQIVFAAKAAPTNFLETIKSVNAEILFTSEASELIADAAATAFLAGRRAVVELGKEIEFEILNGELKITKKQATALTTALLHLVTNAVAHGIESSGERLLKKKTSRGTIRVIAEQTPVSICISVVDDGAGIDFEKIAQAVDKISGNSFDSEESNLAQAQRLIFKPGFSTAETLTEIAGRGIGLDAAKTAVERAGGTIEVSSKIGVGTTFQIVFPNN